MVKHSVIRFGYDKSNWDKVILSHYYNISIGFTPSTSNSSFWGGKYNWLSISDLTKNGKYIKKTQKHITKEGANNHQIIKKGTIVMSFKLTIGHIGILNTDMFTNEAICHFNSKNLNILDNEFLYYSLSKVDLSSFAQQAVKGVTLNSKSLKNIFIYAPLIDEQRKISSLLSNIDKLIFNEQRKYKKLQEIKNTMLNKLFPKKGSNTPEIRFNLFDKEWEISTLEKIVTYESSNISLNKLKSDDIGSYPLYGATGFIQGLNTYQFKDPFITIVKDGAGVGRVFLAPKKSSIVGTMGALFPKNVDIHFLLYVMKNLKLYKSFVGSTIPHIYFKDYKKLQILLPCKEEQKKIGTYLFELDGFINSYKQKIEKLQNLKFSLLHKMFV